MLGNGRPHADTINKGGGAIALPLYFMKGLKLWLNM
jgi:hypothetical protein